MLNDCDCDFIVDKYKIINYLYLLTFFSNEN